MKHSLLPSLLMFALITRTGAAEPPRPSAPPPIAVLVSTVIDSDVSLSLAAVTLTPLLADQTMTVGRMRVQFAPSNIAVTYEANAPWLVCTTHLAVSLNNLLGIPRTSRGVPIPGRFAFGGELDSCVHKITYVFTLGEVGDSSTLNVSANASVKNGDQCGCSVEGDDERDDHHKEGRAGGDIGERHRDRGDDHGDCRGVRSAASDEGHGDHRTDREGEHRDDQEGRKSTCRLLTAWGSGAWFTTSQWAMYFPVGLYIL